MIPSLQDILFEFSTLGPNAACLMVLIHPLASPQPLRKASAAHGRVEHKELYLYCCLCTMNEIDEVEEDSPEKEIEEALLWCLRAV